MAFAPAMGLRVGAAMRFMLSLAEQGMGSIVTFGVNLWLIRNGEASSYGVYVFWFSVAWVLGTCQGTLILTHLFNLPSGEDQQAQRRDPERLFFSVSLVLVALAGVGVLAANIVLGSFGTGLDEPVASAFIMAFLLYQYARAFAFARRNVLLATLLTGGMMVCAFAGLGLDHFAGARPDATRVMEIVGAAYGLCAVVALRFLLRGMPPMVRPSELRAFLRYLRGSGWMMLGAASGEAISRLYSFVVVGRFGADALARLSAVQVVIRPAWMLSAAWSSVGFPAMTMQRAANDRRGVCATMLRGAVATVAGSALWSLAVIAAWPSISQILYRGRYEDAVGLAYLWAANVLLGSVAMPLNISLLALGEFRRLALLDLAGAAVCVAGLSMLAIFAPPFAIVATLAGQATQIVLMVAVLISRLRSATPLAI
jgi:O-antigen/teichoic acid export membrane protein